MWRRFWGGGRRIIATTEPRRDLMFGAFDQTFLTSALALFPGFRVFTPLIFLLGSLLQLSDISRQCTQRRRQLAATTTGNISITTKDLGVIASKLTHRRADQTRTRARLPI